MNAIDPEILAINLAGEAAIRCGYCGRVGSFDSFCFTPISGYLPRGQYQCPHCGKAWAVMPNGKPTVLRSGFILPPPNKIVEIDARL